MDSTKVLRKGDALANLVMMEADENHDGELDLDELLHCLQRRGPAAQALLAYLGGALHLPVPTVHQDRHGHAGMSRLSSRQKATLGHKHAPVPSSVLYRKPTNQQLKIKHPPLTRTFTGSGSS